MHIPCCQDASTPTALERSILTLAGRRLYTKTPTFSCPSKPTSRLSWSRLLRLSGRTLVAGKGEPAFRRDQDSASASTSYHSPFQPCRRNLPDNHRRPPRATRGGFFFFWSSCASAHTSARRLPLLTNLVWEPALRFQNHRSRQFRLPSNLQCSHHLQRCKEPNVEREQVRINHALRFA